MPLHSEGTPADAGRGRTRTRGASMLPRKPAVTAAATAPHPQQPPLTPRDANRVPATPASARAKPPVRGSTAKRAARPSTTATAGGMRRSVAGKAMTTPARRVGGSGPSLPPSAAKQVRSAVKPTPGRQGTAGAVPPNPLNDTRGYTEVRRSEAKLREENVQLNDQIAETSAANEALERELEVANSELAGLRQQAVQQQAEHASATARQQGEWERREADLIGRYKAAEQASAQDAAALRQRVAVLERALEEAGVDAVSLQRFADRRANSRPAVDRQVTEARDALDHVAEAIRARIAEQEQLREEIDAQRRRSTRRQPRQLQQQER